MPHPVRYCLARLCFLAVTFLSVAAFAQGTSTQTIQFLPISDRPVTSAPFQVVAVPTPSNLPVTFTVQGPATIDNRRVVTLTGIGTVTITATQSGNSQYAATSAQISFQSTSPTAVTWQPPAITYGAPLDATVLHASATAIALRDPTANSVTTSEQIGTSQLAPGAPVTYPAASPVFRYEGSKMEPSPYANDQNGYIPAGSALPLEMEYRIAFTCDCQQFEIASQSRAAPFRIWVDGNFTSLDDTQTQAHYPSTSYILVKFQDRRQRQVKVQFRSGPPFYGITTVGSDTISAPQAPVGQRVIVFGDSWTGPTIYAPLVGPAQAGLNGDGYGEFLGEYFNWDYWISGDGGEGFTVGGPYNNHLPFPQRLLTDVCPNSPDAVVIMGGVNDGNSDEATVQAATNTALSELQTCIPNVPIYFYGPQGPSSAVEQAFAAAAADYPNVHYVDMGGQGWIYGNDPTQTSVGNSYLYFAGHPTPLGHNYLAEKVALDLTTSFPATLPPAPAYQLSTPMTNAGTFSYTTASGAGVSAGTLLPVGSNTLIATFTPTDATDYASGAASATVVVTKANTSINIATQTQNGIPTVTFTVVPQFGGTPTGTLSLTSQGTTLVTQPLSNGTLSYTASTLPSGTYSYGVSYSGDSNFNPSTAQGSVTVTQPVPADFTVSATPTAVTATAGSKVNVNLQITPAGGLVGTLGLTCSGLPSGASCAFSSGSTVPVGGAASQATVVITTAAVTATSAPAPGSASGQRPLALCGVLGVGLLGFGLRRRRAALAAVAALVLLGSGSIVLSGCGGSKASTPANSATSSSTSYTVQIKLADTATPSIAHTTTVTLTVQP